MRIILYGVGQRYFDNIDKIQETDVVAVCDKRDLGYDIGFQKIQSSDICNERFDFIVVTSSKYFDEIASYLFFYCSVEWNKIIDLDYYFFLYNKFPIKKNWVKRVTHLDIGTTAGLLINSPSELRFANENETHNRNVLNISGVLSVYKTEYRKVQELCCYPQKLQSIKRCFVNGWIP